MAQENIIVGLPRGHKRYLARCLKTGALLHADKEDFSDAEPLTEPIPFGPAITLVVEGGLGEPIEPPSITAIAKSPPAR